MADYKSFTHVIKIGKREVEGILDGVVSVYVRARR